MLNIAAVYLRTAAAFWLKLPVALWCGGFYFSRRLFEEIPHKVIQMLTRKYTCGFSTIKFKEWSYD